jgi:hypothetical protein
MDYEITSKNVVLVFAPGNAVPILEQPYDPEGDGSPFATKAEATKWAKAFVAKSLKDFANIPEVIPVPEVVEVAPEPIEG